MTDLRERCPGSGLSGGMFSVAGEYGVTCQVCATDLPPTSRSSVVPDHERAARCSVVECIELAEIDVRIMVNGYTRDGETKLDLGDAGTARVLLCDDHAAFIQPEIQYGTPAADVASADGDDVTER